MTSAPVVPAEALRKLRREGSVGCSPDFIVSSMSASFLRGSCMLRRRGGSALDRFLDALVGAATADVAAHRRINVGVGRMGVFIEQGAGRHDLARLAVAALHDVDLDPGVLHTL